ncbi:hypothetical protein PM082_007267 [Marasmius tenuissimus]|nr:hypothetical protein PM082_007267 [Marasmius tenuissimus]
MAATYGGANIKAWHSNMPMGRPPNSTAQTSSDVFASPDENKDYSPEEKLAFKGMNFYNTKGNGYFIEQSTQPQTIGYSLSDSPVGLLAWIYEKLVAWTDAYAWDDDEVLTWISIYWFSRSGPAASVRTYYEVAQSGGITNLPKVEGAIPLGCSIFPREIVAMPRSWLTNFNVVLYERHEKGGHFAAHEVPKLLVGDLRKMFGKGGPAYGVVEGKDGY